MAMNNPEIKFTERCFEEDIRPELGELTSKFNTAANDLAYNRYGKNCVMDPTDIELTPMFIEDNVKIIMRTWHQSSGEKPAVFQGLDTSIDLVIGGEDAYMQTEGGNLYLLSAREALLLDRLAHHAIAHSLQGEQI